MLTLIRSYELFIIAINMLRATITMQTTYTIMKI